MFIYLRNEGFQHRPRSRGIHGSIKTNSPNSRLVFPAAGFFIKGKQTFYAKTSNGSPVLFYLNFFVELTEAPVHLGMSGKQECLRQTGAPLAPPSKTTRAAHTSIPNTAVWFE